METSQESKAQGWVSGSNAVEVPQGYFLGSLSVSPGKGVACLVLTTTSATYNHKIKKTTEALINFSSEFLDININL